MFHMEIGALILVPIMTGIFCAIAYLIGRWDATQTEEEG